MAYEIISNAYLCRTIRSTKLYARPNDIKPSATIIPEGMTFTTSEEYKIGDNRFFKIDKFTNDDTENDYIGKWISSAEVEFTKILKEPEPPKEIHPDSSEDVEEWLVTNTSKLTLYASGTAGSGLPMDLPVGSVIAADLKVNVAIKGDMQTRYRIADMIDPDGNPLFLAIGMWVRYGTEVSIKDDPEIIVVPDVPSLQSTARDKEEAKAKRNGTTYTGNKNKTPRNPKEAAIQKNRENAKRQQDVASKVNDFLGKNNIYNWQKTVSGSIVSSVTTANRSYSNSIQASTIEAVRNYEDLDVEYDTAVAEGYRQGYLSTGKSVMGVPIGRMLFVHGMPFQFTHYADRRPGSTSQYGNSNEYYELSKTGSSFTSSRSSGGDFYGRAYEQEIAANIPIMSIVPGEPQFMSLVTGSFVFPTYTKSRKAASAFSGLFQELTGSELAAAVRDANNSVDGGSLYQYYSMTVNTTEYFKYVNTLCKMSAILMGLSDFTFNGTKCTSVDWGDYNSTTSGGQDYNLVEEIVGIDGGVSFAYDPGSSITDSLGNSLTDSKFTSLLKGISSSAREAEFVLGTFGKDVNMLSAVDDTDYDSALNQISTSTLGRLFGPQSIVGRMGTFIKNAGKGMNVRFPQIWADSTSSKSYSVEMHFIAPYATNFCKWRYVLVPFFHCFALTAPRMKNSLVNYSRPFLIRAYSKGYFNVEMGMITDLTWRRFGDGGDMISDDGIPTQIDVTMDFTDMYQTMGMSKIDGAWDFLNLTGKGITKQLGLFFNNTGLMDMLGTMSGVNMNRMNIAERLALYWNAFFTVGVEGGLGNFKRSLQDRLRNTYESWISKGM